LAVQELTLLYTGWKLGSIHALGSTPNVWYRLSKQKHKSNIVLYQTLGVEPKAWILINAILWIFTRKNCRRYQ